MTFHILADGLSLSINLLLVLHVIICLLLALVVLMQRPKQEGLGAAFGGGVTDGVFGARATDVLQKGTVWLGTLFFVITLILAILIGKKYRDPNFTPPADDKDKEEQTSPASDATKTPAPAPTDGDAEEHIDMPKTDPTPAPVAPPATPATPPVTPPTTPPVSTPPVAPPAAPVTPPAPAETPSGEGQ
ncbi:MAG: preprotein translocase subunit SecG [Akkermansiaceae bacterium]